MYVFRYTPDEGLLPSAVTAENFALIDEENSEKIQISSVLYDKRDNSVLIYPAKGSIYGQNYTIASGEALKNSDGTAADFCSFGIQPLMSWEAENYGVSVLYSSYKKDGKLLYRLKGAADYEASFEVINTSGTDYDNLAYTVCPMSAPELVLSRGTVNIAGNGTAMINVTVNDYVMEADDDLTVVFDYLN